MKDPFVSLDEIKKELKEIEDLGTNLARSLSLLNQKITYLVAKIKSCETINFAREYFDLLDEVHAALCQLVFSEEIGIPDRLRNFVTDFDNLEANREYLFTQIKEGNYKL